jgi:hypothetical protein
MHLLDSRPPRGPTFAAVAGHAVPSPQIERHQTIRRDGRQRSGEGCLGSPRRHRHERSVGRKTFEKAVA